MVRALALVLTFALVGCMTEAPPAPMAQAVPGAATITVTRSSAPYAAIAAANVDINGVHSADLYIGQSYSASVRPGPTVITASMRLYPGRYSVKFNAVAGGNYHFAIEPRYEVITSGMMLGAVGQAVDYAANSDDHNGAFKIVQTP